MNSIHNPTISVKLREGTIEVRDLSWPDALQLYGKVKEQLQRYLNESGEIKISAGAIVDMVTENIELGTWLVKQSTGKDENWLMQRSLSEVLEVATEAAVLNIGIIVERIKNGKSRLAQVVAGANTTQSSKPQESTPASPTKPSS